MLKRALFLLLGTTLALTFLATPAQAASSVNNFTISKYNIDYTLSRDTNLHSLLTTKETITANFPSYDQNHGIERYLPKSYKNHATDLRIGAVTDGSGAARNFTTYGSGDFKVIRIGDAQTYLHGEQTFVITYSQQDVTNYFANTNADEFYWDTNGTEWQVPIDDLSVSLTVDKGIASALTGKTACYQGASGSSATCSLYKDTNKFEANASQLEAGQNVSIAVGFRPGTFAQYQMPFQQKLLGVYILLQLLLVPLAVAVTIWLWILYRRRSTRKHEITTIVPEYLPPAGTSVSTSARLVGSSKTFAAQLIDLAVRKYIKLYQTKQRKGWFSNDEYAIEIIRSLDDLLPEERELLNDIFNNKTSVGTRIDLADLKNDRTAFAARLADNSGKLLKLFNEQYHLYAKSPEQSAVFKRTAKYLLIFGILLLSVPLLITALIAYILSKTLDPITDKGLDLQRYLLGLKMYIGVAEKDRLHMLQSPEGALKVGDIGSDTGQLVNLYERVLPYAILFNQEKEWNAQLNRYYQELSTQPDWFSSPAGLGLTAFNVASLSSSLNATALSATNTSSSSGGSGGGGFSGGGGGGGGGGGW